MTDEEKALLEDIWKLYLSAGEYRERMGKYNSNPVYYASFERLRSTAERELGIMLDYAPDKVLNAYHERKKNK